MGQVLASGPARTELWPSLETSPGLGRGLAQYNLTFFKHLCLVNDLEALLWSNRLTLMSRGSGHTRHHASDDSIGFGSANQSSRKMRRHDLFAPEIWMQQSRILARSRLQKCEDTLGSRALSLEIFSLSAFEHASHANPSHPGGRGLRGTWSWSYPTFAVVPIRDKGHSKGCCCEGAERTRGNWSRNQVFQPPTWPGREEGRESEISGGHDSVKRQHPSKARALFY